MNTLSECKNNYLVVVNSPAYKRQLYKLCLDKVKDDRLIALITSEICDFSTLTKELCLNKDQLKNFVIMYFKTIEDISSKLLLMHSWSVLPCMVVVDLFELLYIETETCSTSAILMQKVALCAVSLLVYLQAASNTNKTVNGFLILQKVGDDFGATQIQIIKDLYFYKTETLESFDKIQGLQIKKT